MIRLADGLTFGQIALSDNKVVVEDEILVVLIGVNASGLSESSFVPRIILSDISG